MRKRKTEHLPILKLNPVLSRNPSVPRSALRAVSRAPDIRTRPQTICDIVRPQNARTVFFGGTTSAPAPGGAAERSHVVECLRS